MKQVECAFCGTHLDYENESHDGCIDFDQARRFIAILQTPVGLSYWRVESRRMHLNGDFTADELEALAWWARKGQAMMKRLSPAERAALAQE